MAGIAIPRERVKAEPIFALYNYASLTRLAAPHEKDAYIAPIATSQDRWVSPRLEEIRKVSACVEKNGQARSRFAASQVQADYQMLYAIDVLVCQ